MQVIANASEDDLKTLLDRAAGRPAPVLEHPDRQRAGRRGTLFPIDDIGYILDPNQRSAVVKGYVPNPDGKIRGAQLVTASIPLDPPADVVEIDVRRRHGGRLGHTYVFVQADEKKSLYTLRRVKVTQRFDKVVYVKTKLDAKEATPTPEEKESGLLPLEPLHEGDKVLRSGVLELKKELEDRESDAAKVSEFESDRAPGANAESRSPAIAAGEGGLHAARVIEWALNNPLIVILLAAGPGRRRRLLLPQRQRRGLPRPGAGHHRGRSPSTPAPPPRRSSARSPSRWR